MAWLGLFDPLARAEAGYGRPKLFKLIFCTLDNYYSSSSSIYIAFYSSRYVIIISDKSSFSTSLNFFLGGSTAFLTFDPLLTFKGGYAGADVILADTGGILLFFT